MKPWVAFWALIFFASGVRAWAEVPCSGLGKLVVAEAKDSALPKWKVQLDSDGWLNVLSDRWVALLSHFRLPQDGTVVEIAPGKVPKIGHALAKMGFRGTVYVVEPHGPSLESVVAQYRILLPRAKIVPVQSTLAEAANHVPKNPDALLANHPLDDMIVGRTLDSKRRNEFFSKHYENSDSALTEANWKYLEQHPEELGKTINETVSEWAHAVRQIRPRITALSQYASFYQRQNEFSLPDRAGATALAKLKGQFGGTGKSTGEYLRYHGVDPDQWMVHVAPRDLIHDVRASPAALARLGDKVMLPTQATRLPPEEVDVVYVNEDLLRELGYGHLLNDRKALEEQLKYAFALDTLAPGSADAKVPAWVDRQTDPLGIAMNKNRGSGRAIYVGSRFNIKGSNRTPLVVNPANTIHGTGQLEFGDGVWEALAGNTTNEAFRAGGSPVLAVMYKKSGTFPSPLGQHELKHGSIVVRLDEGTLTRPVHLFEDPKTAHREDLGLVARQYGRQDGERFIQRLVHGAWSSGNISTQAHFLDMDTVSAVEGRSPQHSFVGWFPTNYFGLEGLGQKRVVHALAADPGVNSRRISPEQLKNDFDEARSETISEQLLHLFGMDNRSAFLTWHNHRDKVRELASRFESLAQLMYPKLRSTSTWDFERNSPYVYDLSRLFQILPLLESRQGNKEAFAKELLRQIKRNGDLEYEDDPRLSSDMKAALEPFLIRDQTQLTAADENVVGLAKSLLELASSLRAEQMFPPSSTWTSLAYSRNQSRPYLSSGYGQVTAQSLAKEYEAGTIDRHQLNRFLGAMIGASNRNFEMGPQGIECDRRVYREGELSRRFETDGKTRMQFRFFEGNPNAAAAKWEIDIDSQRYPAVGMNEAGKLVVKSPELNPQDLLKTHSRVTVLRNGEPIALSELNPAVSQQIPFPVGYAPLDRPELADADRAYYRRLPELYRSSDRSLETAVLQVARNRFGGGTTLRSLNDKTTYPAKAWMVVDGGRQVAIIKTFGEHFEALRREEESQKLLKQAGIPSVGLLRPATFGKVSLGDQEHSLLISDVAPGKDMETIVRSAAKGEAGSREATRALGRTLHDLHAQFATQPEPGQHAEQVEREVGKIGNLFGDDGTLGFMVNNGWMTSAELPQLQSKLEEKIRAYRLSKPRQTTVVHYDGHPGNFFYDSQAKKIYPIDLETMGYSFLPSGKAAGVSGDPMADVGRFLGGLEVLSIESQMKPGATAKLKQDFLGSYFKGRRPTAEEQAAIDFFRLRYFAVALRDYRQQKVQNNTRKLLLERVLRESGVR